jgi:plastocyanin
METEEYQGAPRGLLLSLGLVGLVLGGAIAGEFVFRLQPQIQGGSITVQPGVASVAMPPNAAVINFSPVNITVIVGANNTIQWTNQDTIAHTVVVCALNGPQICQPSSAVASSPTMAQGDRFKLILNASGTYHYFCSIHPATMRGTILVKGGTTIVIPLNTAAQHLNYFPAVFTVVVGMNNTVTFVNEDRATHTVTAQGGAFNSGDIKAGHSWTYTFTTPGTYLIFCAYHGFMKGTVTVKAA